ncbi:MAG: DNA primase [Bacteroidetes bacterium]|nr:DNA primase [Bacteroidota bacterium]
MISKPTIARIIESARIEEVVGDFLTLKKRGVNYIARCPFHNEKTPSFNVNPVRNIFKCFGCGKGGDSVSFVMEHEKMNYPEALRYLAKKYNIEIEEIYDRNIEEEKKLENERESLYVVNTYAQKYFTETLLNSDEGKSIGLSYFKERGLADDIIQKFQLGYAREGRTIFTDTAIKEGYNLDYLVKTGLTIRIESEETSEEKKQDAKIYDRFAGRVMFPIHNITGRVIGFGGRALKKEVKAKYVNSPESEIYHKSNVLYGMNVARKAISNEDNCFLVEGYMDVISMHIVGIENVVASSGTSLTVEQIRLIKRYTNNITIMYDGDPAGIKASFRGIDMILEEGLNVRVVLFPEGDDPDSYSRKHSETEVKTFINENKTDFIRFKTQLLYEDVKNDPIKKSELIKQIVESIALIPNAITRMVFIQECSKIMKMDEQALLTELNKALRKRYAKRVDELPIEEIIDLDTAPVPQPIDTNRDTAEYHEKEIIRLLLNYGDKLLQIQTEEKDEEGNIKTETENISVARFIVEHLLVDNISFEHELYGKIFAEFGKEEIPALEHFIHHEDSEISRTAIDLTTFPYSISDWKLKHGIDVQKEEDILKIAVEHAIYSLKVKKLMQMINETQKEIEHAESEEDILTLVAKKKMLDQAKNAFSKELGWVVLR